ncbi:MAG: adenylate/guanylate cyclase domain-containing protein [Treponema sp.]|jgi:class 3 adenylate cyclase|nr:adenylate/guanylate cyclase domain-containing protein [Treponema sp.]
MKKKRFWQKVGGTTIVPISAKILAIVTILLLMSNFVTNYLTISLYSKEVIKLNNQLLTKELKEIYINAGNQYQIFLFSGNRADAMTALKQASEKDMAFSASWALGATGSGDIIFKTQGANFTVFPDKEALAAMVAAQEAGEDEGARFFTTPAGEYFGVYKYHENWGAFLIRAELMSDMMSASRAVFLQASLIIIAMVVVFLVVAFLSLKRLMRFVGVISQSLYDMQQNQEMTLIDLKGAPSDDISYVGVSFNALSSLIGNLLGIFRKFASQDVVDKAYHDRYINLEGQQQELTVLFTDIRSFTKMTETLGNDIIDVLNLHYNNAIRRIHEQGGIVGSIIGDALLAVYGIGDTNAARRKSLAAVVSGWELHDSVAELRHGMLERRKAIERERRLTEREEEVFKAVFLDIGVGIDGGSVFYGTIGSLERMANTVIGDNVNSASRLEGLTRIYQTPIIVSEYVMQEVVSLQDEPVKDRFRFFEIDTVQVKGKTNGQKIFFPMDLSRASDKEIENWERFEKTIGTYYRGDWGNALSELRMILTYSDMPVAKVFIDRLEAFEGDAAPDDWRGVWTMKTK